MTKDLKYIKLEYNDCDKEYIDDLSNDLEITSEKIVNFFNLDNYGEKINIKLFDNLNNFRRNRRMVMWFMYIYWYICFIIR